VPEVPPGFPNKLQAQHARELDQRHGCHKIAEKGSEMVPLGDGWRWAILGVFVPVVGLGAAYLVARVLKLDLGYSAGLLSGSFTESPVIGTASEAIRSLSLPDDQKQQLIGHIAVADAICYLFGTLGVIWICSSLGPKLLKIDLRTESRNLESSLGIERSKLGGPRGNPSDFVRTRFLRMASLSARPLGRPSDPSRGPAFSSNGFVAEKVSLLRTKARSSKLVMCGGYDQTAWTSILRSGRFCAVGYPYRHVRSLFNEQNNSGQNSEGNR
jgi:hypothetical protein